VSVNAEVSVNTRGAIGSFTDSRMLFLGARRFAVGRLWLMRDPVGAAAG
jgi:hypothetical protein